MANDLLNLLLCHEEQLKSTHSGGVTLGSISSWQKMRLTIEQSLKKILLYYLQWQPTTLELFWRGEHFSSKQTVQMKNSLMLEFHNFFFDLVILKKSLELKAYCSNGHAMANLFLKDAIYKKGSPLLLLEKNPVTNLGCEGTWHLYKLATNWTLVYGHLNSDPRVVISINIWPLLNQWSRVRLNFKAKILSPVQTRKFNTIYTIRENLSTMKSQKIPIQVFMD